MQTVLEIITGAISPAWIDQRGLERSGTNSHKAHAKEMSALFTKLIFTRALAKEAILDV